MKWNSCGIHILIPIYSKGAPGWDFLGFSVFFGDLNLCGVFYTKMNSSRKVCEHSLRWILAMRKNSHIHGYNSNRMCPKTHPEVFGDLHSDFGHSGGSFNWTVKQSILIDKIGLDAWIATDNAMGYGAHLDKVFGSMFGVK